MSISEEESKVEWSPYFDLVFVHCLRKCDLIRVNRNFWRVLMRDQFYSLIQIECPLELFEEKMDLYEEYILTKCRSQLQWYPLDASDFSLPKEWLKGRED